EPACLALRPRQAALRVEGQRVLIEAVERAEHRLDHPARIGLATGRLDAGAVRPGRAVAIRAGDPLGPIAPAARTPDLGGSAHRGRRRRRRVNPGAVVTRRIGPRLVVRHGARLDSVTPGPEPKLASRPGPAGMRTAIAGSPRRLAGPEAARRSRDLSYP